MPLDARRLRWPKVEPNQPIFPVTLVSHFISTMVKTSRNCQAYPIMGHFCTLPIPKEAPKIWWWPVVIYYGKSSLIVDLSKIMIYPILTYSSMLYIKWHTFGCHWKFLFSPFSTDITQVTCQISDFNVNYSLRYWFLKRVS